MEEQPKTALTKKELETLVGVLEQVQPSKLSDARILIALSDKLQVMMGEVK